jgi:type III restriction enzyme
MPRKKTSAAQPNLLEVQTTTAPCVPQIRAALEAWRKSKYKGATDTSRLLLNYWFHNDHRLPDGHSFSYHPFQREAMETLVYLFEVAKARRQKDLLEKYCERTDLSLLQYDDFARYCIKMATGSGKTKVMALAVAWQYFNAVAEAQNDYAKTFLLIAPNVIVLERLASDFAGSRIFRADPIVPPELQIYWDFQTYVRGEGERGSSNGALYLTNIQQFHERNTVKADGEPDAMTGVLGAKPSAQKMEVEDFSTRIQKRCGPLLVLNDEAHHTHDEKLKWNEIIRGFQETAPGGLAAQLDFTATPRHSKGALFTWTVYDYPLKQAILDNIVKQPIKGVTSGIQELPSEIASVRYQPYLTAGVERWKEYREQLVPIHSKKPVLFMMLNDTKDADDVGDWLRTKYPSEFGADENGGAQLLIIHTDRAGEVSKTDLEKARQIAREVDSENSPVNCIVSVLMLREGWDVQNVTVIVGLRPYTSKANILPEQTIGRGLRLMFRGTSGYKETVDIIGNKAFLEFVEQLEREEDLQLQTFEPGKDKLSIVTIAPDPEKMDKDIALPVLSPVLVRKKTLAEEIAAIDVNAFQCSTLPRKRSSAEAKTFHYEGYDIFSLQKLIERDYKIPEPQTPEEVIGYYARRIAQEVKLPSQFSALVPKVREFLEHKAFGETVSLSTPGMIKAISSNIAHYVTVQEFVKALRQVVTEELEPQLLHAGRNLSETPRFPYSRPTLNAGKTVFNLVPCNNEFERTFAKFLQDAADVERFSALPEQFAFAIEYTDAASNLRYYRPDFVAVTSDGVHHLIETKGREDLDVQHKDRAAQLWCENATQLTALEWRYVKVPQTGFGKLRPDEFADLQVFTTPPLLLEF